MRVRRHATPNDIHAVNIILTHHTSLKLPNEKVAKRVTIYFYLYRKMQKQRTSRCFFFFKNKQLFSTTVCTLAGPGLYQPHPP